MVRPRTVALVAVVAAASVGGRWLGEAHRDAVTAVVVEVADGDTVVVERSGRPGQPETVRLLGVDTPETVHPRRGVECFGPEAAAFTRSRLEGRTVRLEFDTVRHDPYDRLLAFVHVDGRRFNDVLLAEGYARLMVIPPNGRHGKALLRAELAARHAGRGLWAACGAVP